MGINRLPVDVRRGGGRVWRFAGREFDESRLELKVNGRSVDLELKPLELLMELLRHAGEVVAKDQLLAAVWPGLSVVDASLATAVHKLRKALRDDDSTIVVTVPRVGYRLAAAADTIASPPLPSPDGLELKAGDPVRGREHWRLIRPFDASDAVWLAQNPKTHELRVFKFVSDGRRLKMLKREVTVFRFLRECLGDRPDFIRIFEWNFDFAPFFLEAEYGGPNLAEWGDIQGGLANIPIERRLCMLADIAEAVAAAHEAGVLHKDLKPANVLVLSTADGREQIKLADFGSASLLEPSRLDALGITGAGLTQTVPHGSSLTGTLMYIAPEVLGGSAPTALADVYALGVMLYQFIIGDFRKPLAAGWERAIGHAVLRDDIAEAACGDPSQRLGSAAALADRLRNVERRSLERERVEEVQRREGIAERKREEARVRRPWVALAGIAILVSAAILYWHKRSLPPVPSLKTVAVLPFQNTGSDHSLDFLSQALPDEIATSLSYARPLSVRSFTAVSKYAKPDVDPQKAGKELSTAAIITGHFLNAGNDVEIVIEALDVKTGTVFWRDNFIVPVRSMIEMRGKLLARTQGTLVAALGASPFTENAGTRPANEEAYELYLRAAAIPLDPTRSREAIAMLERSVGLDATFAPSWLALGRHYYAEGRYGNGGKPIMERFEASIEQAASLDPYYTAAAANLAVIHIENGELDKALEEAEDLVHRRPDSADAHHLLGGVLRYAGLLEESSQQCEITFRLDPHTQTSGLRSCAIVFALRGDYHRAVDYLNVEPASDFSKAILLTILLRQGRTTEAFKLGSPHIPQWGSYDMLAACAQHKPASEITALASNVQISADSEANYLAAANLAYCGQTEQAVRLLKLAIQGKYCSYPAMDSDPFFASVRVLPEFAEIRRSGQACQERFLQLRRRIRQTQ
jgi:DNA-binding winged helix-turn-helix (wHTH) protein/serine/threonine protein kinase/tetratricopeptide (TPR) repeat protein